MNKKDEFKYDEKIIKVAIDKIINKTMQVDLTWDWPCGVAFYGICKAWEVTQNTNYLNLLTDWVDEYLKIGLPPFTVNAVSMGHTMITLHQATGDEKYLKIAMDKAEYLKNHAIRFGEKVFQHTVSQNDDFPEQAWADTLFMAALFLLRMGIMFDNKDYVNDALNQYYWHEEFLQNDTTNLYYHGWNNIKKDNLSGIFWARGNAWAAYTMAEALQLINYIYPMFMRIEGSLRDQLSALVRLQSPEGLWHTILTDESSYLETSASSGIAASLVLYGNVLHKKYVYKSIKGMLDNISDDGSVKNVSAGTAIMTNAEDYKKVPKKRVQGWGQGLALTFLSSVLKYKP